MRSYWIRVGSNPMTGVLIRRGNFGYRHRRPHKDGSTDWSDAATEARREAWNRFSLRTSRKNISYQQLDFGFPVSRL